MVNSQSFSDAYSFETHSINKIIKDRNFHPQDIPSESIEDCIREVVTHEFGHQIDYELAIRSGARETGIQAYDARRTIDILMKIEPSPFVSIEEKQFFLEDRLGTEVSTYACETTMEMFAEAFAQYRLGTDPSGLVKDIVVDPMIKLGITPVRDANAGKWELAKAFGPVNKFERLIGRFHARWNDLIQGHDHG
jgi:hypothetical protein